MARIGGVEATGSSGGVWGIKQKGKTEAVNNPQDIKLFDNVNSTSEAKETQKTEDSPEVKQAKKDITSEFTELGCNVVWNGNVGTLISPSGKSVELEVQDNGDIKVETEKMAAIVEEIKTNNPKEQQAVDNMNNFIAGKEVEGQKFVGNPVQTQITSEGKSMNVLEFKTESGESYYLNDDGIEVKPD